MLCSILHTGSRISRATGRDTSTMSTHSAKPSFLTLAAQCLVSGRYGKARPYSIEALLLYGICMYNGNQDQDVNAWMIMGVAARLAMRMGYHRDPRHLSRISPFEGEMRRRAFMILETFDLLLSSQAGLPAIIHDEEYDTEPPSNLYDEDFDENCETLPPSRPPTDPTHMLYYRYKGRSAKMLRQVFRHALSLKAQSYEETIKLDKMVHEMHDEVPPTLRMRSISTSIVDEPYMILWRLNIDLQCQKSLCVLHREYISHCRSDSAYDYSRKTCIAAALRILEHQAELHSACQPGARLYNEQWMLSSLILHDFLLATMIVCLDLYEFHRSRSGALLEDAELPMKQLKALKVSHEIWSSRQNGSKEARRASKIFAVMLSKFPKFFAPSKPMKTSSQNPAQTTMNDGNVSQTGGQISIDLPSSKARSNIEPLEPLADFNSMNTCDSLGNSFAESLDPLFTDPDNIDWVCLQCVCSI